VASKFVNHIVQAASSQSDSKRKAAPSEKIKIADTGRGGLIPAERDIAYPTAPSSQEDPRHDCIQDFDAPKCANADPDKGKKTTYSTKDDGELSAVTQRAIHVLAA